MNNTRWLNLIVGIFMLSGIAAFIWLAFSASDTDGRFKKHIKVTAQFNNVGSLKARAPVMMSGVRVGNVSSINLHNNNFVAIVELNLDENYQIPEDSIASINTAGLVGEQYVSLQSGQSSNTLKDGGQIQLTKSAMALEGLLESFSGGNIDNIGVNEDLLLKANFSDISSLKVNAPVMLSGIRIGSVHDIILNPDNFTVTVEIGVSSDYTLPKDSAANIKNSNILGSTHISLEPGQSSEKLVNGDYISFTKSISSIDDVFSFFGGGSVSNTDSKNQVVVTASFTNIGSLKVDAPVMISGVRVGNVTNIGLDLDTFNATVELTLDAKYGIPKDTSASIYSSGIIGQQYISLEPGGSLDDLAMGDKIRITQPALVLERLIGQFVTSMANGSSTDKKSTDDKE